MITDVEVKKKIYDLYFVSMYSYRQLERYFKKKYSYAEIKSVIMEKLRNYPDKKGKR